MDTKLTKETVSNIESFLIETGFEIWNAGCTLRLRADYSTDGFAVCEYGSPFQPIKVYKNLNKALEYMAKEDNN